MHCRRNSTRFCSWLRRYNEVISKGKELSDGTSEHQPTKDTSANTGPSAVNLKEAKVEIIKELQRNVFPSEIKSLQNIQVIAKYGSCALDKEKKTVLRKTSSLHKLNPFLERDSITRVGGQTQKADLSEALKNLIILPKSSHVTNMEEHTIVEKGSLWAKLVPLATGLSAEIQWWDSLFPNLSHVVIS